MANATSVATRPEWGDFKAVEQVFGIKRGTLYRLADEGKIKYASLRERGQLKGKRLFSMDSIAAFIEARVMEPEAAAGKRGTD